MTLSVYDRTKSKYGGNRVYNMKEANATRGGGNVVKVNDEGHYGFEFELDNDVFSVFITHKTAEKLLYAISQSRNAEFFLLQMLENSVHILTYKERWARLSDKVTAHIRRLQDETYN